MGSPFLKNGLKQLLWLYDKPAAGLRTQCVAALLKKGFHSSARMEVTSSSGVTNRMLKLWFLIIKRLIVGHSAPSFARQD